ncbi:MAG: hypothetical protein ACO31I_14500 [Prochlorotrichaceae cyanobacterium]|jgi:protein TonB
MSNALPNNLNQSSLFAVLVSIGIHLLAFSGLQAATRQTPRSETPASVDVVELSAGDLERLPDFVQQQLNPNTGEQSFALFPPLQGQTGGLPGPNLPPTVSGDPNLDSQFYSSNFNSPYLDTFLNNLPPPPPEGGWFSGSSVPILPNPVVIPESNAQPLPGPPQISQPSFPRGQSSQTPTAGSPPSPTASQPTGSSPAAAPQNPSQQNPIPNPVDSIIEIPQGPSQVAVRPQPTPNPTETLLPSAVSEIQALQEKYRDRYAYNPAQTSVGEAQALLTSLIAEVQAATGQEDLQPEPSIQIKLAFPDPVCPRNAGGISIAVLVDAQGYLIESRLLRSSGYDALDDIALANVNQRSFAGQANGRYTLYQYLASFADLDGVCFADTARLEPTPEVNPEPSV